MNFGLDIFLPFKGYKGDPVLALRCKGLQALALKEVVGASALSAANKVLPATSESNRQPLLPWYTTIPSRRPPSKPAGKQLE